MDRISNVLRNVTISIGSLWLLSTAYTIYRLITFHFIPRAASTLARYDKTGGSERAFGIITGASAGIGLGIARGLLRRGLGGVILLGHDLPELEQAKAMLLKEYPSGVVELVHHNVLTSTEDSLKAALEPVMKLRITILVNNVGGAPVAKPRVRPFTTLSYADINAYIDLNARFQAQLTALLLPHLERNRSPHSLILNLSSGSTFGMPYVVMYTALKSFNLTFSRSLQRELRATHPGIDVLAVQPGDVLSQSNDLGLPKGTIGAMDFGEELVDRIGIAVRRGMMQMSPVWTHRLGIGLMNSLPDSVVSRFGGDIMGPRMAAHYEDAKIKEE